MLKIKDDIDLKVLEKFEFGNYINKPINSYLYQVYDEDDFPKDDGYIAIGENKKIGLIHEDGESRYLLDKIYDLIQAGLIEKVEE